MDHLQHPIISGSSYGRIRLCPGFAWLQRLVPRVENDWTRGGTLLHEVCARVLMGKPLPEHHEQFLGYAQTYTQTLVNFQSTRSWSAEVFVGDAICGGTIDALSYTEDDGSIIVDLKTGAGRRVEPDDWQLRFYAAVDTAPNGGILGIYQPPFYGATVKTYRYTADELNEWREDVAKTKERVIHRPELVPGAHCDECKARAYCREQKPKKLPKITKKNLPIPSTGKAEW